MPYYNLCNKYDKKDFREAVFSFLDDLYNDMGRDFLAKVAAERSFRDRTRKMDWNTFVYKYEITKPEKKQSSGAIRVDNLDTAKHIFGIHHTNFFKTLIKRGFQNV